MLVSLGQPVKAGQLLALVEHEEIGWQARQAQAAAEAAAAGLENARQVLASAETQLRRVQALKVGRASGDEGLTWSASIPGWFPGVGDVTVKPATDGTVTFDKDALSVGGGLSVGVGASVNLSKAYDRLLAGGRYLLGTEKQALREEALQLHQKAYEEAKSQFQSDRARILDKFRERIDKADSPELKELIEKEQNRELGYLQNQRIKTDENLGKIYREMLDRIGK